MRSTLPVLTLLAVPAWAPAQVEDVAPPTTPVVEAATDASHILDIRLRPGQVWRQSVRFRTELETSTGGQSRWTLDYKLRLRCVEETDGLYAIDAKFIDWLLRLEHGGQRYEWHEGRFRVEDRLEDGPREASALLEDNEPLRELLFAWSNGLRLADVRFSLSPGGEITRLHGLERLREQVSGTLVDVAHLLPQEIALYFGAAGLDRADCALTFALAVPRPVGEIEEGSQWTDARTVAGITPGMCEVSRAFTLQSAAQERRHRFATVAIEPSVCLFLEDGERLPLRGLTDEEAPNELRLLLNNGLALRSRLSMSYEMLSGGVAHFELVADLTD